MSHNGTTSPKPLAGPAGYTLPGVIGYLTSEFTNLERFKIVNNIEKSEMKFKIQQLVSEVNSLKFINNKQALRIKELEAQLLRNSSNVDTAGHAPPQDQLLASIKAPVTALDEIPPIDLHVLRDSRLKLNRAIKDALDLLKPPTTGDILQECSISGQSDFEKLLDESNSSQFFENLKDLLLHKDGIFSFYTLNSNDVLPRPNSFQDSLSDQVRATGQDKEVAPIIDTDLAVVPGEESETETVIVDEPDVAKLLIADDDDGQESKDVKATVDDLGTKLASI